MARKAATSAKEVIASDAPEPTGKKHGGAPPFKPGQSGNPAGRPKGARNKLGEVFLEALHDDFNEHGVVAIQNMRATDPGGYVRVIAGLLPKEFKIETTSDLTDEELDARIRALASLVNLEVGTGEPSGGAQAPEGPTTAH